jgi:TPR repeat protein
MQFRTRTVPLLLCAALVTAPSAGFAAPAGEVGTVREAVALLQPQDGGSRRDEALAFLREAAAAGDAAAATALGKHLMTGAPAGEDSLAEGLALLEQAGASGNAGALETLGRFYLTGGPGVPADGDKARDRLARAAAAGSGGAAVRLAQAVVRGEAGPSSPALGVAMLERLIADGNPWASTALGRLLLSGATGLDPDVPRALALLERDAAGGSVAAIETLGAFHLGGAPGFPPDGAAARRYLKEAVAKGSASARLTLADALLKGTAGLADRAGGLQMLEDAATSDPRAAIRLGTLRLNGAAGLPADPAAGLALLEPIAEAGSAEALEALGRYYLSGGPEGTAADGEKARSYLARAAQAGSRGAKLRLAEALLRGERALLDPPEGRALLEDRVAEGDTRAMIMLAEALLRGGPGLARDPERARSLFDQAIARDDKGAELRLAQLLLRGGSLPRDTATAERMLQNLADAGDGRAAVTLGNAYLLGGNGIRRSRDLARRYLTIAADTGQASAHTLLARGHLIGRFGRPSYSKAMASLETARSLGDASAAVVMAEARIFGWGGAAKRPAEGIALLEREAEAGNRSALLTLIRYARDGIPKVRRPSPRTLEDLLARYEALSPAEDARVERLLATAARARSPSAFAEATAALKQLPLDRQLEAAGRILSVNPNLAVYLMQDALRATAAFEGEATGILDRATVRAIVQACRRSAGAEACTAPLSAPALLAVLPQAWAG